MASNSNENEGQQQPNELEQFRCKICFENFSRKSRCPLTLNCGHTFCRVCTAQLANGNRIQCGICRKHTYSDWTKLGKNITLIDALDWAKLLNDEPAEGVVQLEEGNAATFDGPNQFIVRSNIEEFFDELSTLDQLIQRFNRKDSKALLNRNRLLMGQFSAIEQQLRNSAEAFEELKHEVRIHHEKVTKLSIGQMGGSSMWDEDDDDEFGVGGATIVRFPNSRSVFGESSNGGAFGSFRSGFSGRGRTIGGRRRARISAYGPSSSAAIATSNSWLTDDEENVFANGQSSSQAMASATNDIQPTRIEPNEGIIIDTNPLPPAEGIIIVIADNPSIQPIVDANAPNLEDVFDNEQNDQPTQPPNDAFGNSGFGFDEDTGIIDSFARQSNQPPQQGTTSNGWGFVNNRRFGEFRSTFSGASTNSSNRRRRNRNYWRPSANFAPNPVPDVDEEWGSSDGWGDDDDGQRNESQPPQQQNGVENEENLENLGVGIEDRIWFSDWRADDESIPRVMYDSDPDFDEYEQMQIAQIMNEQMEEAEIVNELLMAEQQMEIEQNEIESIQVEQEMVEEVNENEAETERNEEKNEEEKGQEEDEIVNDEKNQEGNEVEEKSEEGTEEETMKEDEEKNEVQGKEDEVEIDDGEDEEKETMKNDGIEMEQQNKVGGEEGEEKSENEELEDEQTEMEKNDEEEIEKEDEIRMERNEDDEEEKEEENTINKEDEVGMKMKENEEDDEKKEDEVEIEENDEMAENQKEEEEVGIGMSQTNLETKEEEMAPKQMEMDENGKLAENGNDEEEEVQDDEKENEEEEKDVNANNELEMMKEGGKDDEKGKMESCSTNSHNAQHDPPAAEEFMTIKLGNRMVTLKRRSSAAFSNNN